MASLLEVSHVSICYNGKEVVHDVSFTLSEGEILGIVGESGSGKSTLLQAVIGLLGSAGVVSKGDIYFRGGNIIDMPERERIPLLGAEIGMVFQDSKASLCPVRTIGAQVHEALAAHRKISRRESAALASELMQKVGLADPERVLASYPFELSGGMNQRVGICIAMLMHPRLLLADEPTSALDVEVQRQVMEELLLMNREYRTAIVLVTHNIGVVRETADRVIILKDGRVVETGESASVFSHPQHAYTKALMESALYLDEMSGRTADGTADTAGEKQPFRQA